MKLKLAVALLGAAFSASCNQGPPPVGVKQFMAEQVQPTAQIYWDAVRFVSDETGNHDIQPETDADWEKVRTAGVKLQEYGKLLMTEPYTEGHGADWSQIAQGLVDVGKQAELSGQHKSIDEVFEVGGTIYSVCSACHLAYPAETPGAPAAAASTGASS